MSTSFKLKEGKDPLGSHGRDRPTMASVLISTGLGKGATTGEEAAIEDNRSLINLIPNEDEIIEE